MAVADMSYTTAATTVAFSTSSGGGGSSSNPFSSQERENFPRWSPMFAQRSTTPSNLKKQSGFQWSIDQMSKLKPVDIATSPASLAITNITSPQDDPSAQIAADQFFSQKSIFPSPWTETKVKHVTFSPLPPTTSYYNAEEDRKVDAATQTALTIPVNVDLEELLGREFYIEEESSFSLRRKLFGHPQRSSTDRSLDDEKGEESCMESKPHHDTQLSSTPLKPSLSPAVYVTKVPNGAPLSSSFVENSFKCSPPLSPIGGDNDSLQISPIAVAASTMCSTSDRPAAATDHLKVVKRHVAAVSPQGSPALKQQRIQPSPTHHSIPPPISLNDLQSLSGDSALCPSSSSTTCTTYFNNMGLEETLETRPLHSHLLSSWQPNIHSTMLEGHQRPAPPSLASSGLVTVDSGVDTSAPARATPTVGACRLSPVKYPNLPHSLLPSRLKLVPSVTTPNSRYTSCEKSPFSSELIRKKSYFKAKLNFASPVKHSPLRIPLQDRNSSLSPPCS